MYSDYGADFYSNGLGAMEDYIKENPEVTRDSCRPPWKA